MKYPRISKNTGSDYGFSLVELLVVIVVLAVLISLAFPVFSSIRQKSLRQEAATNLRQIGLAHMTYASENYGMLPPLSVSSTEAGNTSGKLWMDLILPYLNIDIDYAESHRSQEQHYPDTFYNPLVTKHHPWSDFGVNRHIYHSPGKENSMRINLIQNLHTIMLMDAGPAGSYEGNWMLPTSAITNPNNSNVATRSDLKLAAFFFDGSVHILDRQEYIENSERLGGPDYNSNP